MKKIICKNCSKEFEYKENQVKCPHCGKLIPVENLKLTELDRALWYMIRTMGKDVPKNKRIILSTITDLLPGNMDDIRLMRCLYMTSEAETAVFAKMLAKNADVKGAVQKFTESLNSVFYDKSKIDKVAAAFLFAYDHDADKYMGGQSHADIDRLSHNLHHNEFVQALQEVHKKNSPELWKNTPAAAAVVADFSPQLQEEIKLIQCIGVHGETELYALVKAVCNTPSEDMAVKIAIAELQKTLRNSYMDSQIIDFFLEAVLGSAGLEYTQKLYHPQQKQVPKKQFVRPRRKNPLNTVTQTIQGSTANQTGNKTSTQQGTVQQGGIQTSGTTPNTTNTPSKQKNKYIILKIFILIVIIKLAVSYVIIPIIYNIEEIKESEKQAQGQEAAAEQVSVPDVIVETDSSLEKPKFSTSSEKVGNYEVGTGTSFIYHKYTGWHGFDFCYPTELYEGVNYSDEDEEKSSEIEFYCNSDPSKLIVAAYPTGRDFADDAELENYKNSLKLQVMSEMIDAEVVSDRQSVATSLGSNGAQSFTFYIKGKDATNSSVIVYQLYYITDKSIQKLIIKYPEAIDTEDLMYKEYYVKCMYDLCEIGGNTDYPEWSDFKKNYGR